MFYKLISILILNIFFNETGAAQTIVANRTLSKNTLTKTPSANQRTYNIRQLTGKWQEIVRTQISDRSRSRFEDTMQLNFNKRDSVLVRDGINISQKGYATVEGSNKLEVAGDSFTIVSLSNNFLVLNDGEYIRRLQRKKRFYYETLGNIILPKENLSDPVVINAKKLTGKWDVYRTQATPGVAEDSAVIKQISFNAISPNGSLSADVSFTKNDETITIPATVTLEKGKLQITGITNSWSLYTYKADGNEFIFGRQGGLVYFAKKF